MHHGLTARTRGILCQKEFLTEYVELTWIFSLEGEHPQELADLFLQDMVLASLTLRPLVLEDLTGFRLLSEK